MDIKYYVFENQFDKYFSLRIPDSYSAMSSEGSSGTVENGHWCRHTSPVMGESFTLLDFVRFSRLCIINRSQWPDLVTRTGDQSP